MLLSDLLKQLNSKQIPEELIEKCQFIDIVVTIASLEKARLVLVNTVTNTVIYKYELTLLEKPPIDYSDWLQ